MAYDYNSIRDDYLTPPEVYNIFLELIGKEKFGLDVCCTKKNIPAKKHFINGKKDGLTEEWEDENFLNPPFKPSRFWIRKAVCEQLKGKTTFAILPVHPETKVWKECILENPNTQIFRWITKNRKEGVTFMLPETMDYVRNKDGEKGLFKNPLALVIFWGDGKNRFEDIHSLKAELEQVKKNRDKFKKMVETILKNRGEKYGKSN